MGRTRKRTIEKGSLEIVKIPTRDMVELQFDLTKKGNKLLLTKNNLIFDHDVTDKIVKIVVTYNHGDELLAEDFSAFMFGEAKKHSKHVYPVEKKVIGNEKQRLPELSLAVEPIDAVQLWLKNKHVPAGLNQKKIIKIFSNVFSEISLVNYQQVKAKPFTFSAIGLENWKCFRNRQSVSLTDGIYSVVGQYKDQVGRSNRSGKSAFASVIPYVLWKEAKASQDRLVNDGQDSGWTYLKIIGENGESVIGREVLKKGAGKVVIDGIDNNTRDGEVVIDKLIGLGGNDFLNSCFVTEGQLAGLMGEKSTVVENHIRRWLGIDLWDEVSKTLKIEQTKLDRELNNLIRDRVNLLEVKEQGKPTKKEIDDLQKDLEQAYKEQKEQIAWNSDIERQQDDLELLNKYEEAKEVIKQNKTVEKDFEILSKGIMEQREKFDSCHENLKFISSQLEPLIDAIQDFDGKCPIDSAKCPRANDFNSGNLELQKKIDSLEKVEKSETQKSKVLHEWIYPRLREESDLEKLVIKFQRAKEFVKSLKDKVKNISTKKLGEEFDLTFVENGIRDLNNEIAEKKHQIKIYDVAMKKSIEISEKIEQIELEISYLNYSILICSRRGIPSIQMEGALRDIEEVANEIMKRTGAEHRLLVSFSKELKSKKETECFDCGSTFAQGQKECSCGHKRGNAIVNELSFQINDKGIIRNFEEDSSGGRALLALAFRIALAKHLGLVVLFLDECDYSFDEVNLEAFLGMIKSLSDFGFRQVFVISHKQKIYESLTSNIIITRGEEFSTVKLGR